MVQPDEFEILDFEILKIVRQLEFYLVYGKEGCKKVNLSKVFIQGFDHSMASKVIIGQQEIET